MKIRIIIIVLLLSLGGANALAADGKTVYQTHCVACHQSDGNGTIGLAPPLAGVLGKRVASPVGRRYVSGVLISGLAGKFESKGIVYNGVMPAWQALSDDELAAVANYVLTAFNEADLAGSHQPYAPNEFAELRAKKPQAKDLKAWRSESEPAGQ